MKRDSTVSHHHLLLLGFLGAFGAASHTRISWGDPKRVGTHEMMEERIWLAINAQLGRVNINQFWLAICPML